MQPLGPHKKDQMHPSDMRNMFIFFVLAALLYFSYNAFILKPQREAMEKQTKIEKQLKASGQDVTGKKIEPIKSRDEVLQASDVEGGRINFKNADIRGTIDLKGGRIDDVILNNYFETLKNKKNVSVLSPKGTKGPRSVEYGWLAKDSAFGVPDKDTVWKIAGNGNLSPDNPVTLQWSNNSGLTFERRISIDDQFLFTITQRVINNSGKPVTLYPYGLISQKGIPPTFQGTWVSHEGPIGFIGDKLFSKSYGHMRKATKEAAWAQEGWLGYTDKYWLTALVPPQGQDVKYSYGYAGPTKDPDNVGQYQADFLGAPLELQAGQSGEVESRLFVGAKRVFVLKDYATEQNIKRLDLAVDFGWFWFMTIPFFYILHYLGLWFGNLGAAIIIMTIMIRGAVFPLTNTSYRSFAKMKKVAPQVTEMREKYGDDKQKMQQELIAMYQREGVNPMSGCLPIILQIPIFFALYKTFFVTIEIRHAPFFGWIQDLSAADPTSIFNGFGLIPWDPPSILMIGVWPCLMLLAMIVQKKLNPPPQDPLQRDMANYMPFLFAFIMARFPAGLVIYWTCSALIGVIQQMIIMKSMDVPIHLFGETQEEKDAKKAVDEGPALHPLSEMAEDEIEEAMFGKEDEAPKVIKPPKPKKRTTQKKKKK